MSVKGHPPDASITTTSSSSSPTRMRLLTILAVTLLHPGVGHPAGSYAVTQTTSRTMLSSTQDVCQGAEIKPYISPPRLITQYIRTPSGSETARLRLAIQAKSGRPQSAPSSQALQSVRALKLVVIRGPF